MKRRNYYNYNQKRRGSKVFWIFIGIIAFAAIFFPFFGSNLVYQIQSAYSIVREIGKILCLVGSFMLVLGSFVFLFISRKGGKYILIGLILIIIGLIFIDPFNFNFYFNFSKSSKGYH